MITAVLLVALAAPQEPGIDRAAALAQGTGDLPAAQVGTWTHRWEDPDRWPEGLRELYVAALEAYRRGDLVGSLHHLHACLHAHPDFPAALHQLGVVCFRLRRNGDAVEAFERLLAHAPEHLARTRALGRSGITTGRPSRTAVCTSDMRSTCSARLAGVASKGLASSNSTCRRRNVSAARGSVDLTGRASARFNRARTPATPPRTTGASTPAPAATVATDRAASDKLGSSPNCRLAP